MDWRGIIVTMDTLWEEQEFSHRRAKRGTTSTVSYSVCQYRAENMFLSDQQSKIWKYLIVYNIWQRKATRPNHVRRWTEQMLVWINSLFLYVQRILSAHISISIASTRIGPIVRAQVEDNRNKLSINKSLKKETSLFKLILSKIFKTNIGRASLAVKYYILAAFWDNNLI